MKRSVTYLYFAVLVLSTIILITLIINQIFNTKIDIQIHNEDKVIEPDTNKISLFMVGDALIHSAVYYDASTENNGYNFLPMIDNFNSIVSNYDLAFYNQETILGGTELGLSSYPCFNSPYEVGDAFINVGFNLVSLANNHTLDRGKQAIINSKNYWNNKEKVITAGSYSSQNDKDTSSISTKNGIKYAFFAYTDTTNGIKLSENENYLVNVYNEETVKKDILGIIDTVDVVIVSMHWGEEYSFEINNRQREIANYLSNLGVNIIIGHHPHVVEPIEYVNNTLVIYSLGNFISAQRGIDRLTGAMVSLDIVKKDGIINLKNIKAGLTYTSSTDNNGIRSNFKVYPYKSLNDTILPNYQMYYNKYINILLAGNNQLEIEEW